jgi:lipoprotein LpqB-like beta-propeller protein
MSRRVAGAAIATVLVAAGCTNVPNSSAPQVIGSVQVGQPDLPTSGPGRNDLPRTIVSRFLDANAAADTNHNGARQYLTKEERNRWSDGAGTTIITSPQISNPVDGKVTVSGREIGTISGTGIYTPTLRGDGTGTDGLPVKASFGVTKVKGQGWRISSLQPGLLISKAQFEQYQQRVLYFFDGLEQHLVPDLRYTQLADPHDLEQWLITGLAQGPRDGLANGLPNQIDPKRARVTSTDALTRIEIPGASGLNVTNRDRLGAQVAATLAQTQVGEMQITDGGQPVRIPAAGGSSFSAADLVGQFVVTSPESALYYLRDGAIYNDSGHRLPGKVGTGAYALTSAALSSKAGTAELLVAGVRADDKQEYLDVGTTDQLIATKVHGALSRPAWAPDVPEVWVGNGPNLYRVSPSGAMQVVPVDAAAGSLSGTVTAVRLSPEGSRVALVLKTSATTSQIYVGSVVRSSSDVRVTNLAPISPQGIAVQDVAWNDELKLFAVGTALTTRDWGLYEVQCDGSLWSLRSSTGLPQAPDSLTVTANSVAVVSTGGTVWQQQAGSWEPLVGADTLGSNPIYLE